MIRLMGLISTKPIGEPVGRKIQEAELTGKQKELDVDKDGEIEGSDLAKLRSKNETHEGDHEVSMTHSTLDSIIKNATELKSKMGMQERNIPAWIQDHITNAENYIDQANTGYNESEYNAAADAAAPPAAMKEKSPEGWEGTVKAMKDEPGIDNPWALAHWMKGQGYKSHKGR